MSKTYNYGYKKKPRIKKFFVFGDLQIPLNVGYETTIDLLNKIEQAKDNGDNQFLVVVRDVIKEIFGEFYDEFIKEFEKDGDKLELEDFGDISNIVIASLQNIDPEQVDETFRNNK